ncbi:methyltransferase domain-containing protein [Acidisphaera sp. L21]|uniref:methyltransferase domain-containing protein n=1 Tax=Acidisphaera sp. L21 TaxID=1641851 RepID=UPI00131B6411|nr:methyltransferase domain-containing protein [Acidisphaera sp. L21]
MSGKTFALDWEARFKAERTPWERPSLHPAFTTWRASGALAPCRIMLPGAGRSAEPRALAQDGFDVTIVDAAATAVAVQQARFQSFSLPGRIEAADLLEWTADAPFDAVYDQTCLCALPPPVWPSYVAQLHRWLRPGGRLFLLLMQTGKPDGPPFDCPPDEMRTLFGAAWQWPDTLIAAVPHWDGKEEIPVVLTRL